MLKYIVRDLTTVLRNLPQGLVIGVLVVLVLSAIIDKVLKKKKIHFSVLAITGFLTYVMIMLCITFISRLDGDVSMMKMNMSIKSIDLALFSSWGRNDRNHAYVIENVLLFIPYGFLGAWVFKPARKLFAALLIGMLSSLAIEWIQLVTGTGIFQIDDVLTNTLGTMVGYILFRCVWFVGAHKRRKSQTTR